MIQATQGAGHTIETSEIYLTPAQACELIPGFTVPHMAQLRFLGTGPKYLRPTPRKILYRRSDVIEWLEASERTTTAESA